MATTETAAGTQAITKVVQLYVDGASRGDAGKLKEAFHEQAWMYGAIGGQRFDMPISQMIEISKEQPLDSDGSYAARITSIEELGDVALARVEEEGCWGNVSFLDLFTLAKIGDEWKIVNKTFVHTGGEMPAS